MLLKYNAFSSFIKSKHILQCLWQDCEDAALKAAYKETYKAAKKAVAMVKSNSMKLIHEELNTKEGKA